MKHISIIAFCVLILLPGVTFAGPVIRSGEDVSVSADQKLESDFYGAGESITISGLAEHDVFVVGTNIVINGEVREDLTAAGANVQVHSESGIGDDVRIFGGEVVISGPVKGDVVVAANSLKILSTATIDGDLIFYGVWGGDLTVLGDVAGSVHGTADTVRVDSHIGGDIEFSVARSLVLGDKASIEGDIVYSGVSDVIRSQNAVVVGNIQHNKTYIDESVPYTRIFAFLITMILFSSLSAYFLARGPVQRFALKSESRLGFYGLIGLGVFLATPFVSTLLMLSMVGGLVGLTLFTGYIMLVLLSAIMAMVMIGHLFQKFVLKHNQFSVFTPFLGSVIFVLLIFIPIIGGFVILGSVVITLGTLSHSLYLSLRN